MSEMDESDRTEEPTPERRKKAREEGQFPKARDTGAMAATLAVLGGLVAFGGAIFAELGQYLAYCMSQAHALGGGGISLAGARGARTLAFAAGPLALLAALAATSAGFAEAGFHPKLELKWDRLEPFSKLRQLFSPKNAVSGTLLSLFRVGVVGLVAWHVVEGALPTLLGLTRTPLRGGVATLVDVVTRLALWSALALALLSAVDFLHSWWQHEKQLKMSRQELKEELHQQEGNPRVKARQRAIARERLKRSVRKEVKTADVIVTNPTHVAVAIRYRPNEGAPVVACKGYDDVAQFIKKLAADHGIPMVENVPLARALAERVKAGRTIPVDLYAAVAEVLAFVYRLRNRGIRA